MKTYYVLDSVLSALHVLTYLIVYAKVLTGIFQKIKKGLWSCICSKEENGTRLGIWGRQEPDHAPCRLYKGFWILF